MIKITKRGAKAWVTFTVRAAGDEGVCLKGSWNGWKPERMKRKKNGELYLTRILRCGERYEFGYLSDGGEWFVDESRPRIPSPFGSENSVLPL